MVAIAFKDLIGRPIFSRPAALLGLSSRICARTSSSVILSKAKDCAKPDSDSF